MVFSAIRISLGVEDHAAKSVVPRTIGENELSS